MGLFYALAHAPYIAQSPDDLDGVNFVLGLREFDLARHQPHPPGYPVYIVLGRLVSNVLRWSTAGGASSFTDVDVAALSIISYLSGALAVVFLVWLFWWLEGRVRTALLATLVVATCPLFWFTGGRPLSDLPGLMLGVIGLAGLLAGRRWAIDDDQQPTAAAAAWPARLTFWLAASAFIVALATGVRAQAAWLCVPLLLVVLTRLAWRRRAVAVIVAASFVVGVLLWAVPLVMASGGLDSYLAELDNQSAFDLTQARTFWTNPTPQFMTQALRDTFVSPWGDWRIAAVVLALAISGVLSMARSARATLGLALAIDGSLLHRFGVASDATFLETVTIPADLLAGNSGYAELTVEATRDVPSTPLAVSVMQFDVRSGMAPMVTYGTGWHAAEYGRTEGRPWRWMSREARIHVSSFGRDVRLRVTGDEPLRYFRRPSRISVSAGGNVVKTFIVGIDFDLTIALPRDLLESSGGVVTLRADQSFVPAATGTSADARELALRIWTVDTTFDNFGSRTPVKR